MKVPFAPPHVDDMIVNAVIDTIKSGWITTGPKTKLFEQKITEYCNCKRSICLNSATSALEMVLRWFGIEKGDEVIIPVYTYCATANVVIHCGATPVFVDINENDFNISIDNIKNAITDRTKVIMPVDIAGFPCDYDDIYETINASGIIKMFNPNNNNQKKLGRILVLSDAAHSLGARYKGRKSGTMADFTVFSFHAVKNLTTAEGGAISINLPEQFDVDKIYNFFNINSLHGQNKDALAKTKKNSWKYDVISAGYKANMTDILASIGLVELKRYDMSILTKRKYIFDRYTEAFSKKEWAIIPPYENSFKTSSYHLYLIRVKNFDESKRDEMIQYIFDEGVSVNVHFQPLPLLTYYKSIGYNMKNYPIAYKNYSTVISLPVFYDITDDQIDTVIKVVNDSYFKLIK